MMDSLEEQVAIATGGGPGISEGLCRELGDGARGWWSPTSTLTTPGGSRQPLRAKAGATARTVARAIFDGVDNGEEDIFPDPMSASVADGWRGGPVKAMERQNAAFVPPQPALRREGRNDV